MATEVKRELKTEKDLENLFSWLIFYRDNKQIKQYQKCQEQIDKLVPQIRRTRRDFPSDVIIGTE